MTAQQVNNQTAPVDPTTLASTSRPTGEGVLSSAPATRSSGEGFFIYTSAEGTAANPTVPAAAAQKDGNPPSVVRATGEGRQGEGSRQYVSGEEGHSGFAILFGAAAYAAADAAQMIDNESLQQTLDQEEKKMAQEANQVAASTAAAAQIQAGQEQKQASDAQGYGYIASGVAQGGAEVGSMGYSAYRSSKTDMKDLNTKINNNKAWQQKLRNPEEADMVARKVGQKPVAPPKPTPEELAAAKERLLNIDPDQPVSSYPKGEEGLAADIAAVKTESGSGKGSALREARKTVKDRLDENKDAKKSYEAETDDVKGKLKTLGQVTGSLAQGAEKMEEGRHQYLQGIQQADQQIANYMGETAKGVTSTLEKVFESRSQVVQAAIQMVGALAHPA